MFWNKKLKEKDVEKELSKTLSLQRFQPFFITIDGEKHEGYDRYKWINADELIPGVPDYLMQSIVIRGYIEDKNNVMYPLNNILSIEWRLIGEKTVLDNFTHDYTIQFGDDEVEKMTEYKHEVLD